MGVVMFLVFMSRVFVLMAAMLPGMLMVMYMCITGMVMLMRMFMKMLMRMDMFMLVEMNHLLVNMLMGVFGVPMFVGVSLTMDMPMAVLMAVDMGMLMRMQMLVFVLAFHGDLPGKNLFFSWIFFHLEEPEVLSSQISNTFPTPRLTEVSG
jgi:hypothetical protein